MTTSPVVMKGSAVVLESGDEVHRWVEIGDDGVAVVFVDDDGEEVGRVSAPRRVPRLAAQLSLWTSPPWRRRGLARAGLDVVLAWAADHEVPFLVTDVAADAGDAEAFVRRCPLIVAARTDEAGRRFTFLVPGVDHAALPFKTAIETALTALEGGASQAEADATYEHLRASTARHPSSRVA